MEHYVLRVFAEVSGEHLLPPVQLEHKSVQARSHPLLIQVRGELLCIVKSVRAPFCAGPPYEAGYERACKACSQLESQVQCLLIVLLCFLRSMNAWLALRVSYVTLKINTHGSLRGRVVLLNAGCEQSHLQDQRLIYAC